MSWGVGADGKLQGYLAHKKRGPRGGGRFFMIEVPQQNGLKACPRERTLFTNTTGAKVGTRPRPGFGVRSRKHGLSTEQFPVSAYAGNSKNLKDLNGSVGGHEPRGRARHRAVVQLIPPLISHVLGGLVRMVRELL